MHTLLYIVALTVPIGAFVQAPEGIDFTGRWILESFSAASPETPRALSVAAVGRDHKYPRRADETVLQRHHHWTGG